MNRELFSIAQDANATGPLTVRTADLQRFPLDPNSPPQYFPGRQPDPVFIPPAPAPRGRWIWVPENDGMCDACRRTGICSCYRPERGTVYLGIDTASDAGDTSVGVTFSSSGETIVAISA